MIAAINGHEHHAIDAVVCNTDRATGARIAGAIAKKHGNRGWKGSLHVRFTGCAAPSPSPKASPKPNPQPQPQP